MTNKNTPDEDAYYHLAMVADDPPALAALLAEFTQQWPEHAADLAAFAHETRVEHMEDEVPGFAEYLRGPR